MKKFTKILTIALLLAALSTVAFASDGTGIGAKEMAEIAKMIMQQSKGTDTQKSSSGKGVGIDTIISAVNTLAKNKGDINSILGDAKITAATHTAAVSAVNEASVKFYRELAAQDKNLFFSPYSISAALAMLYAGSRGQTAAQFASAMSFSPQIHSSFYSLINQINAISPDIAQIHTANAIWPAADKIILSDYKHLITTNYFGEITTLDYSDTKAAANTINRWVGSSTKGKIKNIVSLFALSKDTPLTLTNAIYLKSDWQSKFERSRTAKDSFTLQNGNSIKTDFMTQTGYFDYFKSDNYEIAELPYKAQRLSMYVILPAAGKLHTTENNISAQEIDALIEKTANTNVYLKVSLPKFKLETDYDLDNTLKKLGLAEIYTDKANFSGMNGLLNIAVGKVLHKTYLDVNEEGTEAAAATYIGMKSLAARDRPMEFKADRPFIFIIRDNTTGANLFMGRYSRP